MNTTFDVPFICLLNNLEKRLTSPIYIESMNLTISEEYTFIVIFENFISSFYLSITTMIEKTLHFKSEGLFFHSLFALGQLHGSANKG
jgi:hypothetical protein